MASGARLLVLAALCWLLWAVPAAAGVLSPAAAGLNPLQAVRLAAFRIQEGQLEEARALLSRTAFSMLELEIERLYLLGQVALREKKYQEAIETYRYILDHQPELSKVRLELALAYMATEAWARADYHMRLAASGELPPEVRQAVNRYLYIIRQNKNWNLWFTLGLDPNENINGAVGGEECVTYSPTYGQFPYPLCRKLDEPEKALGASYGLGGDYEFKFGPRWRLKSDFSFFGSSYDKSKYDQAYLGASIGPRYVFPRGDVWLAATGYKLYYGHSPYRESLGLKMEANYDFRPNLSGSLALHYQPTSYDGEPGEYMDGDVYGAGLRLAYSFEASKYLLLKAGLEREDAKSEAYANLTHRYAVGFGAELPWGFRVYLEPSLAWTNYDGGRYVVAETANGSEFTQVKERQLTQRYLASISNNKIDLWGFTPTLTYTYTDRNSNISARSYKKNGVGFSLQQRF